ncbi:MAG: hypothetical protein AAF465_06465 [Pseudomonadota bacterium]
MSVAPALRALAALLVTALASGCVTEPWKNPENLPPEAMIDDGIDHYSAQSDETSLFGSGNSQWDEDEDGNRVYLLNRLDRNGGPDAYYIGDIRYLYVNDTTYGQNGRGYGSSPVLVSTYGSPLHSQTLRGSRDNTYFQTRRGRVVYLPQNQPPPPANQSDSSGNNTGGGAQSSGQSTAPPSPRPAAPPRSTRRHTAPPAPAPTRTQRTNEPRRTER